MRWLSVDVFENYISRSDVISTNEKQKMIEILKRQKENIENELPLESLTQSVEETPQISDDAEDYTKLMDQDELELFKKLVKDNSIIDMIKSDLKPWVSYESS